MSSINSDISLLETKIGYEFKDVELLRTALSHSSFVNEVQTRKLFSYERLEFLGDSVLELISSEYLYKLYPNMTEGELSKTRASLVCEKTLADRAVRLGLKDFIILGKGEFKQMGYNKPSVLCDVIEAVLGAIFLDGGIEPCREYVFRFILNGEDGKMTDSKSKIQEYCQAHDGKQPEYVIVSETGPDHDRHYVMALCVDGKEIARGTGNSKKKAEQAAAAAALEIIR